VTGRRPRRRPGENRERLVEAGLIEFGLFGYHGASTAAIAARADVPQPHVYASFETKRELFLACLDAACARSGAARPDDAATPGAAARPDAARPDAATPDAARPDAARPDTARPDTATPDTARPDTARPDAARPEGGLGGGGAIGETGAAIGETGGAPAPAESPLRARPATAPVARFLLQAVAAASTFEEIPARLSAVRERLGDASFVALLELGAETLLGE